MINPFMLFILLCLVVHFTYWIATGFSTKKTQENRSGWLMRIIALIVVISAIFFRDQIVSALPFLNFKFWNFSTATGLIADAVAVIALILSISARRTLGANWSANVIFKEDHELITKGPYAYVRHPIYTGVILYVLSFFVYYANVGTLMLLILFFVGAYYKGMKEEKLLIEHIGEQYLIYKKKVKALIPYIF